MGLVTLRHGLYRTELGVCIRRCAPGSLYYVGLRGRNFAGTHDDGFRRLLALRLVAESHRSDGCGHRRHGPGVLHVVLSARSYESPAPLDITKPILRPGSFDLGDLSCRSGHGSRKFRRFILWKSISRCSILMNEINIIIQLFKLSINSSAGFSSPPKLIIKTERN